jgi:hypothetical protein
MRTDLKMKMYTAGVLHTITWPNEAEYDQAKKLLLDMGAVFVDASDNAPEFFGLENKRPLEALRRLRRSPK